MATEIVEEEDITTPPSSSSTPTVGVTLNTDLSILDHLFPAATAAIVENEELGG